METPVTSLGRRSGVNWMRLNVHPIERAIALGRTVLPTPGTSSINTCPRQMTAIRLNTTGSALPTITLSTVFITRGPAGASSSTARILYSPIARTSSHGIQELHEYVRGRVQGVGFRYFVVENDLTLGLRGYVRNGRDDSVEVLAQGPRPALERLLALLRQGPPAAHVSEGRTEWRKPKEQLSA